MCDHQCFHSGEGRYDAKSRTLRYVVVCDTCHVEIREVAIERCNALVELPRPDLERSSRTAPVAVERSQQLERGVL